MRDAFNHQLEKLNTNLVEMGQKLISQIERAMDSLKQRDKELAKNVIALDKQVNELEKEIEHLCLSLLLLQQPVAEDLRNVSAGLKMITDLERIGDQAADIAEITLDLGTEQINDLEVLIQDMNEEVLTMVINVVESFQKKNAAGLSHIIEQDDRVDQLLEDVKNKVIQLIQEKAQLSHEALDYFMVAKHLEKIGDYAVNVVRWVGFYLTGEELYKE